MDEFQKSMIEYREQLKKGLINKAYRGLMEYMLDLRTYFEKKFPDYFVSGSLYYGYMDMTYFSFFPEELRKRKLKIGIVFIHEAFRFEAWLFGYNKTVQKKYWELIKQYGWKKHHVVPTIKNVDSIIEAVLADNPDFSDLDGLTKQIENGVLTFTSDVKSFLAKHDDA